MSTYRHGQKIADKNIFLACGKYFCVMKMTILRKEQDGHFHNAKIIIAPQGKYFCP
jgi:hypothetical protein